MFGKSDPQQQWSVHAEFTISHPRAENPPQAHTEQADNGVRMTYTWTNQRNTPPPSGASSNRSVTDDKAYGFQRGNLLFTSTPPRRGTVSELSPNRTGVQDSGYGSDLLSHGEPYSCNRKCRSTCNIILSTSVHDENRSEDKQCGRTQSLRCQTPTLRCERKDNYYGCGDPWCHHLHYGDDFACGGRFSPVMEACEDCLSGPGSTETFSTVRVKDNRKDASVQTFEMIDKCTSPFLKMNDLKGDMSYAKKDKAMKKNYGNLRRRTEPIFQRSRSPSSITPDSLESVKDQRHFIASQKHRKTTSNNKPKEQDSPLESKSDPTKKPRTVHIDVYCTGTEMESNSSSDSSDNETASTPQTVFESDKLRITHKRADEAQLPLNMRKSKVVESDVDDASTAYPSKLSSYSTIKDYSSSASSVPQSWTTFSTSSCTVPDDYDSVANTSWKDTFSDIDSLLHSRSSIAQTESLDFVPKRFRDKNPSIDETPEIERDLLETPSQLSLQPSDSFEYENSEDRFRIKKMEEFWRNKTSNKQWRSPQVERRYLLQQKKIKEYMEKRLSDKSLPKWESKESDSEGSDASEKGWTVLTENKKTEDAEPTSKRSPSVLAIQQRLSMDPSLRAPFTIVPGIYTTQRAIAKKFGPIVPVVRKPGHHIGPTKNPDCLCDHCQRHFESVGYRGRARSMGDPPSYDLQHWKNFVRYPPTESASNRSVPSQLVDLC